MKIFFVGLFEFILSLPPSIRAAVDPSAAILQAPFPTPSAAILKAVSDTVQTDNPALRRYRSSPSSNLVVLGPWRRLSRSVS
jgi:hypothetical protein